MKKLFLSVLGMLYCSIMAFAVPLEYAKSEIQRMPAANTDPVPMFTVNSEKIICNVVNDARSPWVVNAAGEVESVNKEHNSVSVVTFQVSCSENFAVSFSHCVSSENPDIFSIELDGGPMRKYGGTDKVLQNEIYMMSAGNHTLTFRYAKDKSYSNGEDRAWFKSLTFKLSNEIATLVHVGAPGSLGLETLAKFPTLPDVQYIKVTGTLNNDDFLTMNKMVNLKFLDMSEASALEIPEATFRERKLQLALFPANLKKIGKEAFYCSHIDSILLISTLVLPDGLEEIGESAFRGTSITSCALPASLQKVGAYAFRNCDVLRSFAFSPLIQNLPNEFLYSCDSLREVTNTENILQIGSSCFSQCKKLQEVGAMKPEIIHDNAFNNCKMLENIDLTRTTHIKAHAFYECDSLRQVSIPQMKIIETHAFCYCDSLESIEIPDVTEILANNAFYSCVGLKEVILGASISNLETGTFRYCKNLQRIVCRAPAPPVWADTDIFPSEIFPKATLEVPAYAISNYKLAENWSNFMKVVPHDAVVDNLTLAGTLDLTSNARIPGAPNIHQTLDSHLSINGENPQNISTYIFDMNLPEVNGYNQSKQKSATLISRSSAVTANEVLARMWMNSGKWYFVSYPFDVKMSDLHTESGAQYAVRYYDGAARAANGAGGSWVDVSATDTLMAGRGYIVQLSQPDWFAVKANLGEENLIFANDAQEIPLQTYASATSSDRSWNLVGNPFPAFFDIYYLDFTAPLTVWDVKNNTYKAYSIADDQFALMPMQAFFVQCPEGVSSVKFNVEGRQSSAVIDHSLLSSVKSRHSQAARYLVDLGISDGHMEDVTRIVYNENCGDDYDERVDVAKMMSHVKEVPQIYSWSDEAMYAINEGRLEQGRVNLGIYIPKKGTYTISLGRSDLPVDLIDLESGKTHDLSTPYSFTAEVGQYDQRFALYMHIDEVTGLESVQTTSKVMVVEGGLKILGEVGTRVKVYGSDGRVMAITTLGDQGSHVNLPAGLYIVVVGGQTVKALVY